MMVRYRAFEDVYLQGSQSEMEKTLGDCLVRLYAEVLTHLSYAVTFFKENTISKLLLVEIQQIHLSLVRRRWFSRTHHLTATDPNILSLL